MSVKPASSGPKTDPMGPLTCHRLELRLVSWVKSSCSKGAPGSVPARADRGTTERVTKAEAVRTRTARTAEERCSCNRRDNLSGGDRNLDYLRHPPNIAGFLRRMNSYCKVARECRVSERHELTGGTPRNISDKPYTDGASSDDSWNLTERIPTCPQMTTLSRTLLTKE